MSDMGTSSIDGVNGGVRGQPKTNEYKVVFTNEKDNAMLDQSDFMKLMVAQMQNQDFMNPMDDTQMVEQMVQFSNMQQMQNMASWSRSNYAMSLIGKTVTASRFNVGGNLDTTTGPVQRISLVDDEYILYIGGKKYQMNEIMGVSSGAGDNISMVDPAGYDITVSEIKMDSAEVTWEVPTEDEMVAKDLKYTVYYGTEPMDTVEKAEAGTLAGIKDQKDTTEQLITGLKPNTKYYVNVVVTDPNGIKSIYKSTSFQTIIDPNAPEEPPVETPEEPETPTEPDGGGETDGGEDPAEGVSYRSQRLESGEILVSVNDR